MLKGKHILMVFDKRVSRKTFGPKKDKVKVAGWRKLN
jgi:hypothetical protein